MINPDPFPSAAGSYLLAADPSIRYPGAALFYGGVLVAAATVKIPSAAAVAKLATSARCAIVAREVREWVRDANPTYVVVEWPMLYPGKRAKKGRQVRPKDIVTLAGVAGAIAAQFPRATHASPVPAEWIGQIPKDTDGGPALRSPRGHLITSCLSADELALVPDEHDAVDAVGLGLWGLGRLRGPTGHARPGDPGVRR